MVPELAKSCRICHHWATCTRVVCTEELTHVRSHAAPDLQAFGEGAQGLTKANDIKLPENYNGRMILAMSSGVCWRVLVCICLCQWWACTLAP